MKIAVGIFFFVVSSVLPAQNTSSYRFAEIDSIGEQIETTINEGNKECINRLFDFDLFVDRFLVKSKKRKIRQFNQEFKSGLKSLDLGQLLIDEIEAGSSYNYLKFYLDMDRKFHVLFRLYSDEAGINYHDFLFEDTPEGFKIVDLYIYLTGENWSDTFRALYLGYIVELDKPEFQKTTIPYYISFFKLKKAIDLNKEGKAEEAYKIYQEIPEMYRNNKSFKMNLVLITENLSPHIYSRAIEDYQQSFPNDPGLHLLLYQKNFIHEDYNKCLENIDDLDNAIEGDDLLDLYRGTVYYFMKNYESAEGYFLNLTDLYPDFLDPYDNLLTIYAESQQYHKAIVILEIMIKDFDFSKIRLQYSVRENFSDFYTSDEFKNWLDQE